MSKIYLERSSKHRFINNIKNENIVDDELIFIKKYHLINKLLFVILNNNVAK